MKIVKKIFITIVGILVFYIAFMYLIALIPVNKALVSNNCKTLAIYISTNGVHTDILVPYKSEYYNWESKIPAFNAKQQKLNPEYIALGWGDKGFYLDIEEWSDLDFKTAFKAGFGLSTAAMHVTFLKNIKENNSCRKIDICESDYLKLVSYIESSFKTDLNGNFIIIQDASYANNDVFYDANGNYSLFYTCNTWANQGLKKASQKAAFWTLHDKGIFQHYD